MEGDDRSRWIDMSEMGLLLSMRDTCHKAMEHAYGILGRARLAGGAYTLSAQEQDRLLAALTPIANAINGRFLVSVCVNGAEVVAHLREEHRNDWPRCSEAVMAVEAKIRSGDMQLGSADISALQDVARALLTVLAPVGQDWQVLMAIPTATPTR